MNSSDSLELHGSGKEEEEERWVHFKNLISHKFIPPPPPRFMIPESAFVIKPCATNLQLN